jgi:hypothetical protein
VVGTMTTRPPLDRALNGSGAEKCQDKAHGWAGVVRAMCPETMIAYKVFLSNDGE